MFNRDPYYVLVDYPHLTGFFHCSNPIFKPVLLKPPALLFLLLRDGCEQTLQIFTSMVSTSWGKGAWVVSTHIYLYSKGTPTYPEPTHLEKYAHVKIESFPRGVKNTKEPCWNLRVWYTFSQNRSEIPPSLSGWWFFTNPSPKNMPVKLDHETPGIGVNIPKMFELPPPSLYMPQNRLETHLKKYAKFSFFFWNASVPKALQDCTFSFVRGGDYNFLYRHLFGSAYIQLQ